MIALLALSLTFPDIQRPPHRFQTTGTVLLRTTHVISDVCTAEDALACSAGTVVVMPDPCFYRGETYADLLCHEMAHALKGWRHETR